MIKWITGYIKGGLTRLLRTLNLQIPKTPGRSHAASWIDVHTVCYFCFQSGPDEGYKREVRDCGELHTGSDQSVTEQTNITGNHEPTAETKATQLY